jgi:hypothetical protein
MFAFDIPGAVADPNGLAGGTKPFEVAPDFRLQRFFIQFGLGDKKIMTFSDDLNAFFDHRDHGGKYDDNLMSAAIVLDLRRLAELLCTKVGRPLWEVVQIEPAARRSSEKLG